MDIDTLRLSDAYTQSNQAITGSDNDLSPVQCQTITRTHTALFNMVNYWTHRSNLRWNFDRNITFFKAMHLKMSVKQRPFCFCLIMLTQNQCSVRKLILILFDICKILKTEQAISSENSIDLAWLHAIRYISWTYFLPTVNKLQRKC